MKFGAPALADGAGEEARAHEAERVLRGECCRNCDHYAVITGLCWCAGGYDYREHRENGDWCSRWSCDTPSRLEQDAAASLDEVVEMVGVIRKPGETDAQLRARCRMLVTGH